MITSPLEDYMSGAIDYAEYISRRYAEETDAMVVRIDRIDRADGACRADDDTPGAEVKERNDGL